MGKKAIVIGASSGIGLEVAKILMNQGWTVGVAARRVELLQDLGAAAVECIDVTAGDATEALQRLINKLGGMNLFLYASGIGKQNRELTEDIELATVQTNGIGFTRMIGAAYRYFVNQGNGHMFPPSQNVSGPYFTTYFLPFLMTIPLVLLSALRPPSV